MNPRFSIDASRESWQYQRKVTAEENARERSQLGD